jgi:hypothetical protein
VPWFHPWIGSLDQTLGGLGRAQTAAINRLNPLVQQRQMLGNAHAGAAEVAACLPLRGRAPTNSTRHSVFKD